jgi:uncharacterized integral membrane protein (TIGR00698 family)
MSDSVSIDLPAQRWFQKEDVLAIGLGLLIILIAGACAWVARPADRKGLMQEHATIKAEIKGLEQGDQERKDSLLARQGSLEKRLAPMPIKDWLTKPSEWRDSPIEAFRGKSGSLLPNLGVTFLVFLIMFGSGVALQKEDLRTFTVGFLVLFLLANFAYLLAGQEAVKAYGLEFALWGVLLGLLISNTMGTPRWLSQAARTEFFIKTGLVLLGAEVLFNKLLAFGLPGIFISWVVTPIVLISTYLFGQHILKIPSRSLNLVISADMSVCGVSAAVATAAACRAKKEELSLAIGLSLMFTVLMIVVQPYIVTWSGMGEVIGGAWIGGTIDSTGAVAAAGKMVGDVAMDVATTVKMIQNILIGVVAFAVAVYWVTHVEKSGKETRPSLWEIWHRFPKFTLGFLGVSLVMSYCEAQGIEGKSLVSSIVNGCTKSCREWFFCLAFVSIGLESDFREYRKMLASGKPLLLYLCGQSLNLLLSFLMAWLMFTKVFPNAGK